MNAPFQLVTRHGLASLLALLALIAGGCQSVPSNAGSTGDSALVEQITDQLVAMPTAGEAARRDAQRLATEAVTASRELAADYRAGGPAWLHNCLVNVGVKKRGLCWQWMEDLYPRLQAVDQSSYRLVAGVRDEGRLFSEHHCLVVVAEGRPFDEGIVLDPWLKGGRLTAFPVTSSTRPWFYDPGWTQTLQNRYRHLFLNDELAYRATFDLSRPILPD